MTGRTFLFSILTFLSQIHGSYADIVSADNARAAGDY